MLRPVILAASAFALFALGPVALAASKEIKTSDLDLSTPAGQAELDSRIMHAARAVCASRRTGTRIRNSEADKVCMAQAVASARAALGARAADGRRGG